MRTHLRVLLTATAAVAAVLVTAGCSSAAPEAAPTKTEKASTSEAAALVPAAIEERGYVIVATDSQWGAPTNYHPDGDTTKWAGIEHDLIKAMEPILGVEFRQEAASFTSIITGVSSGRYDLGVSGFQDKVERQQVVDMIDYMGGGGSTLIVKGGNPLDIHKPEDLCGKTAAFVVGSTDETYWRDFSTTDCDADAQIEILTFPDRPAALLAVDSDRAAVTAGGAVFALNLKHNWDGIHTGNKDKYETLTEEISYGISNMPAAFMAPKGKDSIRDAVMAALQEMMDNGEYQEIMAKWDYPDSWLWTSPKLNSATE